MVTIVQKENIVLRKKSAMVPVSDISSARIQTIISQMKNALESQSDGVAIAAPQIGESLRIFVVSKRVFGIIRDARGVLATDEHAEENPDEHDMVFINPEIVRLSRKKEWMEEGCLSVRWLYGKVRRSVQARVRALDEHGKKVERGASGILAQVFQHETDHLNGILFIDNARDVHEVHPEEIPS